MTTAANGLEALTIAGFTDSGGAGTAVVNATGVNAGLMVSDVEFRLCSSSNGGIVRATRGAALSIAHSSFSSVSGTNTAYAGAALRVSGPSTTLAVLNTTVAGCSVAPGNSLGGAGLVALDGSTVTATQLRLRGCSGGDRGGAVYVADSATTVSLYDSELTGNYAGLYGGALYLDTAAAVYANSTVFTNNTAATTGSAVASFSSATDLTLAHCLFHSHVGVGSSSSVLS